jgi:tRNA(fMet)-specific endonuclease VapC
MYLLDTNACIRVLNGTSAALVARMQGHTPSRIAICSVVRAELYYGARHSSRVAENLDTLARFLAPLASLAFDDRAAERYGVVRADLARAGTPIGPNDLLIASIAVATDATLVTNNTGEFRRVPGLRVEDWASTD